MTTRAGIAGIITGLVLTAIIYPLFGAWRIAVKSGFTGNTNFYLILAIMITLSAYFCAGLVAVRWNSIRTRRRGAALGALAGGLAGCLVFTFWGAAAAGVSAAFFVDQTVFFGSFTARVDTIAAGTGVIFACLFVSGILTGMAGGWLSLMRIEDGEDIFIKDEPQMALNASITALPASIVALAVALVIFPRLVNLLSGDKIGAGFSSLVFWFPVAICMVLILLSQWALQLVVEHETHQAEHRCGLDEVKMGAFVGIGTPFLIILFCLLIHPQIFLVFWFDICVLASIISAGFSWRNLTRQILPRRKSLPAPADERKRLEAALFGTIAGSKGWRLVVLCIGCGILMVLPLYISVVSFYINLTPLLDAAAFAFIPEGQWKLFQVQAMIGGMMMIASCIILSGIYIFYLNIGRWFNRYNAGRI